MGLVLIDIATYVCMFIDDLALIMQIMLFSHRLHVAGSCL